MKKKDKTIVFRHFRQLKALHPADVDDMKNRIVGDCLSRGYVPFEPTHQVVLDSSEIPFIYIDVVETTCAFAGKKQARIIGVQKRPTSINLYHEIP